MGDQHTLLLGSGAQRSFSTLYHNCFIIVTLPQPE